MGEGTSFFLQQFDRYCERVGNGLFAEPFNFISNLSFFVAIYISFRFWSYKFNKTSPNKVPMPWKIKIYFVLLLLIGVGSGLWHSLAQGWTILADVIPIGVFTLATVFSISRQAFRDDTTLFVIGIVLFLTSSALSIFFVPTEIFHGSQIYLGIPLFFSFIFVHTRRHEPIVAKSILLLTIVFCLALILRTADTYICTYFPLGSHFLWHISVGYVCYLLLTIVITQYHASELERSV